MSMMLLQSMRPRQGGWQTLLQFSPTDAPVVQTAAEMLAKASTVHWRVVRDGAILEVLAIFDGRCWQAVGESMPADEDMPWWQSGLLTASDWLLARRAHPDFVPTVPMIKKDQL